jgi:hypothetical protein
MVLVRFHILCIFFGFAFEFRCIVMFGDLMYIKISVHVSGGREKWEV